MPKEKVTVTLDTAQLQQLRSLVGARSLSAALDQAVASYLHRARHLAAVDEWLRELERDHGQIPSEELDWAAGVIDPWEASTRSDHRRTG